MRPDPKFAAVARRIRDYQNVDFTAQRDQLVALWRQHHPEAATEASVRLHPLMLIEDLKGDKADPSEPDEVWGNDVYQVTVRRGRPDRVFGTGDEMLQLGISALDGTARHDWREFQAIKNQLAGPECEAFELYPAEARLLDPSNYYTLWCFPGVRRIKVGREERDVRAAEEAWAPQRDLPAEASRG